MQNMTMTYVLVGVAVAIALLGMGIAHYFSAPSSSMAEGATAHATILAKTFIPEHTYTRTETGASRSLRTTEMTETAAYQFSLKIDGMTDPVGATFNEAKGQPFAVGDNVTITYTQGIGRIYVTDMKP